MLGIGRFSGRAAAAIVVIVVVVVVISLFFSLLKWPSKEKFPNIKDKILNYFFGGNFAAPGADFR